jgi:hypothetical protein
MAVLLVFWKVFYTTLGFGLFMIGAMVAVCAALACIGLPLYFLFCWARAAWYGRLQRVHFGTSKGQERRDHDE